MTVLLPRFGDTGRPVGIGSCRPTDAVQLDDAGFTVVRIEEFFTEDSAYALSDYLASGLEYERDEIDDQKRTNRAVRTGDLPDSPLKVCKQPDPLAEAALNVFATPWFITQLETWLGIPLRILRPMTPYRLDPGDYIGPHDDRAAPEFRLSVSCSLTPAETGSKGGETVVGLVDAVEEYDHPEFFFPLKKWALKPNPHVLKPIFNSVLLIVLADNYAHAVREVYGAPRYSVTTLYGDRKAA
jgi:hypothetical protein